MGKWELNQVDVTSFHRDLCGILQRHIPRPLIPHISCQTFSMRKPHSPSEWIIKNVGSLQNVYYVVLTTYDRVRNLHQSATRATI